MVAERLTFRNLTSTPITLKSLERFRAPGNGITRVLSNISCTSDHSGDEPFTHEEVNFHAEPFKTIETELPAFMDSEKERLRWTFEVEREQYQINTPVSASESATMKALSDEPRFQFTCIFLRDESYLTIFSSAHLNAWMGELNDNTLLSSLSIPGTHNSPTCHLAPPSVRCQSVSPREQLRNGVRFFDIRVQPQHPENPDRDELVLVHGVFPISFTGSKYFKDLMNEVDGFLEHNPTETLIISLKREGPGEHSDEQLSRIMRDHYAIPESRWYTEPKIPTVGEVRGKVVLIRRFHIEERLKHEHGDRGWGIDAGDWADNCAHAVCPSGQVCIQDFYEVLETNTIEKKIQYVTEQCHRSSETCYPFGILPDPDATRAHPFYINFLSASNFWKYGTWPEKIAAKLNPATVDYLCRKHSEKDGDWSTGILVTDWVGHDGDWDLVRCIVGMNSKLRLRQMGYEES
ncbi:hypothetical protein AWENTII_004711 [Aspergillus wentii]|nr:hypothetical protein MW887_009196 [Aspergillus wentii]